MTRRLVAGLMLVAGLVPALNAQESPLAAPPKELDQIKWMVGQWSGTMSSTMGDIKTVMDIQPTMGGHYYQFNSKNTLGDMTMDEVVYLTYDPKMSKFRIWAFASWGGPARTEAGDYKDDKLVTVSDPWEVMGMTMVSRSTLAKAEGDKLEFILEFKEGDNWKKDGGGLLTRTR